MCLITVNGLYLRESRRNRGWKFQRGLEGLPFGGNFFFFFFRKAVTGDTKTQQRSNTAWIMVAQQEQPCLKKAVLRLGSGGKTRHQDWSELGSVLALETFNYPGYGFTCLIQYQAQTKHVHSRLWKVKQDIKVTHPLPDLNGYSESHLYCTSAGNTRAIKLMVSKNREVHDNCNIYPSPFCLDFVLSAPR